MTTPTCPTCGAPIPSDAPEGRCPACMLRAGLESGPTAVPFAEVPDTAALEALFPQFSVEAELGRGGMGVVYKARQRSLDRPVALKLLPPEVAATPGFAERFRREARTLAQLSHPGIVAVHEAAEAEGYYVLAMELVDGVNLRQAKAEGLTPEQALAVVPQICDALQYAHDQGVVHRDIKPENIMLTRDGRVKIADFGLAKLLRRTPGDATLTGTEQVMGTFHYLAPEQIRTPKDVDHRADIYSLGVVFYEMLTGDLPIGRFPVPSERVQVDVRLDDVVLRALERERDLRYQQAADVKTGIHDATQAVVAGAPASAPSAPSAPSARATSRTTRLNPWAVGSVLCLPVAVLSALLVIALGARDEIGFIAALVVAGTGVILGAIAKHEIQAAPDRWHGLGLAKAGIRIPLFGGALLALLTFAMYLLWTDSRKEAALDSALASERQTQEAQVALAARSVLVRTAGLVQGMTDLDEILDLIDPRERHVFLEMPSEEYTRLYEAGELGFAMFPIDELAAPIRRFEVQGVDFDGEDRAFVTIGHRGERVRFPMVQVGGDWYLALGRVEHSGQKVPRSDAPPR